MGRKEDFAEATKKAKDRAKGAVDRGGEVAGGVLRKTGSAVASTARGGRDLAQSTAGKGAEVASAVFEKGSLWSVDMAKAAALLVPARLESIGSPVIPLTIAWGMRFGQFVGGLSGIPKSLAPLFSDLDQFGSISLSPKQFEVDGQQVEWNQIKAITLGSPIDAISSKAAVDVVERIRALLPAFPGRKWVVRQVVETFIAICLAIVDPKRADPNADPVLVVTSITVAGRLRRKEIRPGFFALLLSATKPAVATAIVETSRPFGTLVTMDAPPRSTARAAAMRELTSKMRTQAAREGDDD